MKKSSVTLTVSRSNFFSVSVLAAAAVFAMVCLFGASAPAETGISGSHILMATISGQGTISPAGTVASPEGASRSFVFDSDENHRMVDVVVDGISIGPVDAFSFENINASHTIEAVFESNGTLTAESEIGR